ncbi:MAG TPA: zinc-ribbon domain-containing protein [Candidatus Acidoferrum sp.]|jgi:uncharacterized membrane protein
MSFCKACGKELPEGNMFCPACGASVAATTATPAAATAGGGAVAIVDGSAGQPMATNVAGALTYLAGLITGIIFVATEPYKSNSFIRFHAFQSIFFNVAWIAIWMVWMVISAILTPLTAGIFGLVALPVMLILALTGLCTWLFLMYQAYQQKLFRLPFIGKYAAQQAGVNL